MSLVDTPETLKSSSERPQPLSDEPRCRGALYGLFIGDALAMPVHWYYDTSALQRDYGRVRDYLAPRNPHPDSILWRSSYRPLNEKGDILHDQAQYWGKRGIHYHPFLKAGENTLNLKLCAPLIESLNAKKGYSADDYLSRYITFMTTPGSHRDTYVEEYHRHFFTNYATGKSSRQCGAMETHIGGLVAIVREMKRTAVVSATPSYLHVEFRSALFRFIDDVEFLLDDSARLICFRSTSRTGYYDFGVNRRRMQEISDRYLRADEKGN